MRPIMAALAAQPIWPGPRCSTAASFGAVTPKAWMSYPSIAATKKQMRTIRPARLWLSTPMLKLCPPGVRTR